MVAIPQYRAKKIDSDEYVEGFYINGSYKDILGIHKEHFIVINYTPDNVECWGGSLYKEEIDPSTLAISFNNGQHWRNIAQVTEKWR